jgi:hypothetical protein
LLHLQSLLKALRHHFWPTVLQFVVTYDYSMHRTVGEQRCSLFSFYLLGSCYRIASHRITFIELELSFKLHNEEPPEKRESTGFLSRKTASIL